MDGLLLDTEKLSYESFVMTADAYDQKFQFDDYRQLIGRNAKTGIDILQKMLPATLNAAKFKDEWLDVYRQLLDDNIEVKPGAHQLLAYLEKMQIPRAVATSSSGNKARAILDRVGLWQYIPHLTGGDEVKAGKPAPDVYLDAAEKLGVNAPRCIAFEDSETGVLEYTRYFCRNCQSDGIYSECYICNHVYGRDEWVKCHDHILNHSKTILNDKN